jgi:hypothetical protein
MGLAGKGTAGISVPVNRRNFSASVSVGPSFYIKSGENSLFFTRLLQLR